MEEKNEILESLRPWDCEIFEKNICSPFICYGGYNAIEKSGLDKHTFRNPMQDVNLTMSKGDRDALHSFGTGVMEDLDYGMGLESGFGRTMTGAMSGMANEIDSGISKLTENLNRSSFNVANWQPPSGKKPGAQGSTANYSATGTSKASRSGSGKRSKGKLSGSKDTKKQNKSSLYAKKGK